MTEFLDIAYNDYYVEYAAELGGSYYKIGSKEIPSKLFTHGEIELLEKNTLFSFKRVIPSNEFVEVAYESVLLCSFLKGCCEDSQLRFGHMVSSSVEYLSFFCRNLPYLSSFDIDNLSDSYVKNLYLYFSKNSEETDDWSGWYNWMRGNCGHSLKYLRGH
ncbi:MAG: hypothetical protein R2883_06530 [Caldisericia bacterium]